MVEKMSSETQITNILNDILVNIKKYYFLDMCIFFIILLHQSFNFNNQIYRMILFSSYLYFINI